ncbi:carboxymuconolactone decarboxylase [Bifidobacterium pseudolongum subsp. globosum]|uniref:Carboxymuconolactone decarboxylase n=1 Tax=Bifidobacterium pseudolongum subsp. globosum TaxID=1690 RepID=A0A2N3QLQ2_9BIFI|nr:cupin domain-containing protein [Bifidobacterium pseudolongum]PKU92583.1 carboxymuconolactone decarboxylase [Bifidobacterium pseudolongum subsp. globosum]
MTDERQTRGVPPEYANSLMFPVGEPNSAYAQYFTGHSWLAPLTNEQVPTANVTFEPGCINHWHKHNATSGGGQILICVGGRGYAQIEGQDPIEMTPGTVVNIPANTKHWHGAAPGSWFSHLALAVPGENTSNEWLEPVDEAEYAQLK